MDGKTDAIYPISLLIILISFACFTDAKSFPPRCMRIITGWKFCIIISWNLGLSCSQCMPLVPSQTTLLLGIPRFNDPLNSAISCKWVINESPMSQISVSGYKERRIIWPHIEFTNDYIFQRHLTAICPAFFMVSLGTPLAAKSDARPIRKECEEYNCVGKPITRIAFVKMPLNWPLVRGAPLT